jgi:hypothetical protein
MMAAEKKRESFWLLAAVVLVRVFLFCWVVCFFASRSSARILLTSRKSPAKHPATSSRRWDACFDGLTQGTQNRKSKQAWISN